ncbi:MAG: RCC1 domain-containing protein [Polyangiales bacterium]
MRRDRAVALVVVAVVIVVAVVVAGRRRDGVLREKIAPVPSEVRENTPPKLQPAAVRLSVGGSSTCVTYDAAGVTNCSGTSAERWLFGRAFPRGHSRPIPTGDLRFSEIVSCVLWPNFAVDCWDTWPRSSTAKHSSPDRYFPVATPTDPHVLQLAVHDRFACALLSDQTVWCWGENAFGQLGDGTTIAREFPTQVIGLHDVREVSAGHGHTCAVKHGGAVWCWGRNEHGQLGDGTTTDAHAPKLTAIGDAVQVACGEAFSCARRGDGSTMCWGSGKQGQNGDVTFGDRSVPTVVPIGAATRELALGDDFACARGVDERVRCWGSSDHGQLGRGLVGPGTATVAEIAPWPSGLVGARVSMIRAGARHACARLELEGGSAIACWGAGAHGELGRDRDRDASTPVMAILYP